MYTYKITYFIITFVYKKRKEIKKKHIVSCFFLQSEMNTYDDNLDDIDLNEVFNDFYEKPELLVIENDFK